MHETLWLVSAMTASYLGFGCLALSLRQHWKDVTHEPPLRPASVATLRVIGYTAIASTLVLTVLRDGPGFGSVLWVLLLTASATAIAFTLTWRPSWLRLAVRAVRITSGASAS